MLLPPDILKIVKLLKDGKESRKCKIDGRKVEVESGRMKADSSLNAVRITGTYKDGEKTYKIDATHPRSDKGNVIKIDNKSMEKADIDMTLIAHLFSTDLKATLEYEKAGSQHEIELYARVHEVI